MTCEERGIYRELLDHHYTEGDLPTDERLLQVIARSTDKEWKRCWPRVKKQFVEEAGRLVQPQAVEVLNRIKNCEKDRQEAGRKGAKKRWQKDSSAIDLPMAKPWQSHQLANGSAIDLPIAKKCLNNIYIKPPIVPLTDEEASDASDGFENFIDRYPKKTQINLAGQYWVELSASERALALRGLSRWLESREWAQDGGKFVPSAASFLAQKRYLDQPTPLDLDRTPDFVEDLS
jgi:uncharacterized protein YdaU (DUF1376 family)